MSDQFDFNKAVEALKNGQDLTGKDGPDSSSKCTGLREGHCEAA